MDRPSLRRAIRAGAAGLILAAVFGLLTVGLRETFTRRVPGGNDLYPRWLAGCAWLREGADPYDQATTLRIQRGIYGRPALPGEDQAAFAYPAFTVVVTWPLCLTRDFATAHAAAMAALLGSIVLTGATARRVVGWEAAPRLWIWTLFCIVVMYPSARGLLLGQLAVVVALLQVAALEGLRRGADVAAGVLLALSTIKPQMGVLLVPLILFWTLSHRRWRCAAGFVGALVALVAVPMLWLPGWVGDWLGQLRAYTSYTEFGSVTWILTTYYLGTPPTLEIALTGAWLAWFGFEAWRTRRQPFESLLWAVSLAVVLTHFVSPRTATTHFGTMLVPLFLVFRVVAARRPSRAGLVPALAMPGIAIGSWALFLLTVEGRQESAINYLPIPIAALITLLWARRPWRRLAGFRT